MMFFGQKKIITKILALVLSFFLLFNPVLTPNLVLADEGLADNVANSETTSQNQETGEESQNEAVSSSSKETSVGNNNQAEVTNNVEAEANTGDNLIDDPVGGEGSGELEEGDIDGQEEDGSETADELADPEVFELAPDATGSANLNDNANEVAAENESTGEDSENLAQAGSESQTEVNNENEANIENEVSSETLTGENEVGGQGGVIDSGEAVSSVDVANVVNTNLVGEDFWQAIINVYANSDNDIDLTEIEGLGTLDANLISVLAKNENTGDGSINIALANFLSDLAVYNQNTANLTNDINVSANTGDNQAVGGDSLISTGAAFALLNLFNMVNTNLIGENWFFGIINIFSEFEGDLILPYELQYLFGDDEENLDLVSATNENTGDGSQNQSQASAESVIEVTNTNNVCLTNDISVLANSGENEIIGSGEIQTGGASAQINLLNFVNTNIFGDRWLFLLINDFGDWAGRLENWWGNFISLNGMTLAWFRLPGETGSGTEIVARNENTGENSQNQAEAQVGSSLTVENTNQATVENNLSVVANTGRNGVEGESGVIQTGGATAVANVFNFLNTNIIGNNWFFGIVNIFDHFVGDIIFPRPDLLVSKTADKETVAPGDEISYTIAYKNQGRLWAKNTLVFDTLPSDVTLVSISDGGFESGGVVTWDLGTIGKGEEGTVSLTLKVGPSVPEGTILTNHASIFTTTDEPQKANNSSLVSNTVTTSSSNSGSGGSNSSSATDGATTGVCSPPPTPEAPTLLSATRISPTEVELSWTSVNQASYYLIAYGTSSGDYSYGVPNTGEVTNFTVNGLSPSATYYFVVSAVAGAVCSTAGPFSNELVSSWLDLGSILGVQAAEEEKILGDISEGYSSGEECPGDEEILPYILLFLLSSAWLIDKTKKKFKIGAEL